MHRILSNLVTSRVSLRRRFPDSVLRSIERAVRDAEKAYGGEIRFAIETALEATALLRGVTARERAIQVFADLRVWDTAQHNGVLIYLLLAEHDIEIVADRGFEGLVDDTEWQTACHDMETEFAAGRFLDGALKGIEDVSALIARHFPRDPDDRNELSDRPAML